LGRINPHQGEQAAVADADPVGVAREVGQHLLGAGKGALNYDENGSTISPPLVMPRTIATALGCGKTRSIRHTSYTLSPSRERARVRGNPPPLIDHRCRLQQPPGILSGQTIPQTNRGSPFRSPKVGGMIIAPGKAAAAAARGSRRHTHPSLLFPSGLARRSAPNRKEKRGDHSSSVTPGVASLARGYYHLIPPGFQLGSRRSQGGHGRPSLAPCADHRIALRQVLRVLPSHSQSLAGPVALRKTRPVRQRPQHALAGPGRFSLPGLSPVRPAHPIDFLRQLPPWQSRPASSSQPAPYPG
jgi:hypothetical protein